MKKYIFIIISIFALFMPDIYVKKVNEQNVNITCEQDVIVRAIEVLDSINGF